MDRKWMIGIGAGLLSAAALVAVGAGAYELGQRDDRQVVVSGVESVGGRVIVDHDGWGRGPFPLVFPLLIAGIIFLVISNRRRQSWSGPGYGPGCGPGYGPGPGGDQYAGWQYRQGWHGYGPTPPGAGGGYRGEPGPGAPAPEPVAGGSERPAEQQPGVEPPGRDPVTPGS